MWKKQVIGGMTWLDVTQIHQQLMQKYGGVLSEQSNVEAYHQQTSDSVTLSLDEKKRPVTTCVFPKVVEHLEEQRQQHLSTDDPFFSLILQRAQESLIATQKQDEDFFDPNHEVSDASFCESGNLCERFGFYMLEACPLLETYRLLLNKQEKVAFVSKKKDIVQDSTTQQDIYAILQKYIHVVLRYFPQEKEYLHHNMKDQEEPHLKKKKMLYTTGVLPKNTISSSSNGKLAMTGPSRDTRSDQSNTQDDLYTGHVSQKSIPSSITTCPGCSLQSKYIMDITEHTMVCESCGFMSDNESAPQISFKDIDRVNISTKYQYDRVTHFKDCMNQFQGKQNASIDKKVYTDLIYQFRQHGLIDDNYETLPKEEAFRNITKEHIMLFLKETGHTKHYEDVVLLYSEFTGKRPPDIRHLENILLQDFDQLTTLYDKKYRHSERKNFINTQYILYQLLKRHKFPCKKEDFNILKTIDRKYYHDDITKSLFEDLGWNFAPTF